METYEQQQMNTEKGVEKRIEEGGAKLRQENKQDFPTSPPPPQTSNSSSPSHEFSFTISLHQSNSSTNKFSTENSNAAAPPNNSLAVDLSPADEIFFHGHLLPLHLLSHLPQSPRSSTNSMDSFTLPIRELLEDESPKQSVSCSASNWSNITIDNNNNNNKEEDCNNRRTKGEGKSNFAFSLFGLKKGLKGSKDRDKEDKEKPKKRMRFDVIHALKKYLKMVQPIVLFKGKREKFRLHGKSSYSYSGNVTPRNNKQEFRGWGGQYSAPASMRTSPTNSGLLLATTALPPPSDSTMEELQAAIQAAIAHCKNSIAKEEKLKC